MTTDAQKRLEAISQAQDLGAGFMLTTHDLEIRGAGDYSAMAKVVKSSHWIYSVYGNARTCR